MRLIELHLEVGDIARSLAFYTRLFPQARMVGWDRQTAVALVFDDGSAIGLWTRGKVGLKGSRAGEHVHYAVQTTIDELEVFRTRLKEMGVEVFDHSWDPPHMSIYFFDPDGHQGEFITKDWLQFLTSREKT